MFDNYLRNLRLDFYGIRTCAVGSMLNNDSTLRMFVISQGPPVLGEGIERERERDRQGGEGGERGKGVTVGI